VKPSLLFQLLKNKTFLLLLGIALILLYYGGISLYYLDLPRNSLLFKIERVVRPLAAGIFPLVIILLLHNGYSGNRMWIKVSLYLASIIVAGGAAWFFLLGQVLLCVSQCPDFEVVWRVYLSLLMICYTVLAISSVKRILKLTNKRK
jgi:hypothetical protein